MKSIILTLNQVSKVYKLYKKPNDVLKEILNFSSRSYHHKFNALKNTSLTIKKNESLGIIGHNGSGKSTLLRIISGLIQPTQGTVNTNAKITAVLEISSNLNPEMTGLENIEFNLLTSLRNPKLLKEYIKKVSDFCELDIFLNQPVKTYSSGMKARLGFAIAFHSEPDILILDEVFAVGDFIFKAKCSDLLNKIKDKTTIVFVSHSMSSIKMLCERVIVLNSGEIVFDGLADDAVSFYQEKLKKEVKKSVNKKSNETQISFFGKLFHNKNKIINIAYSFDKKIYDLHEPMIFTFSFQLSDHPKKLILGIPIWDKLGNQITGISSDQKKITIIPNEKGFCNGVISLTNIFNPGTYFFIFSIYDGVEPLFRNKGLFESVNFKTRFFGNVLPESTWKINER